MPKHIPTSLPVDTSQLHLREGITPRQKRLAAALDNPVFAQRELNRRSFYRFLQYFWPEYSSDEFSPNWHIELMCEELQKVALRVAQKKPRDYDLIINVPPGSTKTATCSIMFPVWCWTRWFWMRFIMASYSKELAIESADYSRELIRSSRFVEMYPELSIKMDKDAKSNYRIVRHDLDGTSRLGGTRFSTGIGVATVTGFHGHFIIVDDPLNPHQAASEKDIKSANRGMTQTLSTRKTNKKVSTTILIQQRVHQNDPSGHALEHRKEEIRHICLPGQIRDYGEVVNPPELKRFYVDQLLDPNRMDWAVLKSMEATLGQYGFAGQVGQKPTPPGGGMFKVDRFQIADSVDHLILPHQIRRMVRSWDKAGSIEQGTAYTCGVKMYMIESGQYGRKFVITDVKRGRWANEERERIIKQCAQADGPEFQIFHEQEPGSGGKDSAAATNRNLVGFAAYGERSTGDKAHRADPYSVQVNEGQVILLRGDWNKDFKEEHRYFPFSTYKDQVDAAALAFNKCVQGAVAGTW